MLLYKDALQAQKYLEYVYNKNQLNKRIAFEFSKVDFIMDKVKQANVNEKFALDLLTSMYLQKRSNIQTLVGILNHYFNDYKKTTEAIWSCVEADLVDYFYDTKQFVFKFKMPDDIQAELDKYQFPLPMVVKPLAVKNNKDTGYLTIKKSIILKDNYHEYDVCLDHINRVNRVKLVFNMDTAEMVKNKWKDLDKKKQGESDKEFNDRKKAFLKYDKDTYFVMLMINEMNDFFYLTHAYDKRGRTYCKGYHANYQGNDWNKAVIEFARKERVKG